MISTKRLCNTLRLALSICLLLFSVAHADQGDVSWEGWEFSYDTDGTEGLELTDVSFQGLKILAKASFPVMRVEYDNDVCGPFADILWANTYVPIELDPPYDSCNNDSGLCARTYTQDGSDYLELGINSELGEYDIYQSFIFSPNGIMDSQVFSRGLQCEEDHRHHAHWMFDFDIDGSEDDQVLKNSGDLQTSEFNDRKISTDFWTIRDAVSGLRVELDPGSSDGFTDNFAQWDVAVRKWNRGETTGWRLGARGEIGDTYLDSENINRQNIVFWYVAHLDHKSLEGATKWHSSGPRIQVIKPGPVLLP